MNNNKENDEKNGEEFSPPVDEHARAEQLSRNLHWLIARMDTIHSLLCPDQMGTWQQRASQAVIAAQKLTGRR